MKINKHESLTLAMLHACFTAFGSGFCKITSVDLAASLPILPSRYIALSLASINTIISNCMKHVLIIISFLFTVELLHSQSIESLDIKGGINYTNVVPDVPNLRYGENQLGLNFGISSSAIINSCFNMQLELLFNQKGCNLDFFGDNGYETQRRLNYVSLPLLLFIKPMDKIYFYGGLEASYLISASASNHISHRKNIIEYYHRNDFGIPLGIQLNINKNLFGDLRYVHSLTALSKSWDNTKLQNRALQLSVGYSIKKK